MQLEGREEKGSLKTRILKSDKDHKNEWGNSEQEDTPDVRKERTQKGKDRMAPPTPKA